MSDELTLGRKLYAFREDRKFSQSRLEVEAELSFGTISRIENGLINPTKETLYKVSNALNLNSSEFQYMISPMSTFPSLSDVEIVKNAVFEKVQQISFPAYVRDNKFRIWFWNDYILELLGVKKSIAEKNVGINGIQLLLSPYFNLISKVPKGKRLEFLSKQISFMKYSGRKYKGHHEFRETIQDLLDYDEFKKYWDIDNKWGYDPAFSNSFTFSYAGKDVNIYASNTEILMDNRFVVVTYYPKDIQTSVIFEEIRQSKKV